MVVLKFVYFFLQYKMKRWKISGSGCYSTHTQKELKFVPFPRDPALYFCFHSWFIGFIMCCLIIVASVTIVII
jgi:hypothetical protein